MKIAVAGATGKTGRHLVARLCADDRAARRRAHFEDPAALRQALVGAEVVARAGESKNVDTTEAARRLGGTPRPFAEGLAEKLRTA